MSRRTEEEIARVEHDLEGLDDEIRRLELQAAYEEQNGGYSRNSADLRISRTYGGGMPPDMLSLHMGGGVPMPEFGGGGGGGMYGYVSHGVYAPQPYISPLAGPYVLQANQYPQQAQGAWGFAGVASYPGAVGGGYYAAPQYVMPPHLAQQVMYPAQPAMYASQYSTPPSPHAAFGGEPQAQQTQGPAMQEGERRARSGTQSMEEIQAIAAKKGAAMEKPDLGTALTSSVLFTLTMIGEATFFMIRDWLDTTKSRPRSGTRKTGETELEESVTQAALEELEKSSKETLTEKQKMKHVRSMRQLMRATSVGDVVSGLRNSGRDDEAESLARRLLAIRRQMYGNEHMATAQALNQLASVLVDQEDFEEAVMCYEESLQVLRAAFTHKREGVPPLHEAHLLHNLAIAKLLEGQQENQAQREKLRTEAIDLGTRCAEICEKKLGSKHPRTIQYKRVWIPGYLEQFKAETAPEPEPPAHPVDILLQAATSLKQD